MTLITDISETAWYMQVFLYFFAGPYSLPGYSLLRKLRFSPGNLFIQRCL